MTADFQEDGEENPETCEKATTSKQAAKWKEAMNQEMASLNEIKT